MVKCPKCGFENEDNVTFCSNCDSSLSKNNDIKFNIESIDGNKLIIGIIIVAVIIIVAAITLSSSFSTYTTEINGFTFNIPNGYERSGTDTFYSYGIKVSYEFFKNNNNEYIGIAIGEFSSGKKIVSSDLSVYMNGVSSNDSKKVTINGYEGYKYSDNIEGTIYDNFAYIKDENIIIVSATDDSLIEKLVN